MKSDDMTESLIAAMGLRLHKAIADMDFKSAIILLGATVHLEEGDFTMASEWLDDWESEGPPPPNVGAKVGTGDDAET